jgi:hypothetical protein
VIFKNFQFSDVVSFWLPTQVRDLALNDDEDFRTYLNFFLNGTKLKSDPKVKKTKFRFFKEKLG